MNRAVCIVLSAVILLAGVLSGCSAQPGNTASPQDAAAMAYTAKGGFFDTSFVHRAEVEISEEDLKDLTQRPQDLTPYSVTIRIDGDDAQNALLSVKERTALSPSVSKDAERYSYEIDFSGAQDGGTYQELDGFSLNDVLTDVTYMKEYVSNMIMRQAGVSAPLVSYACLTVNGEEKGLFVAVEKVGDSFFKRTGCGSGGALYKPERVYAPDATESDSTEQEPQIQSEPVQFPTDENGDPVPPENAQFPTDENGGPVPPEGGQIPTDENGEPIPPGMQPPMGGPSFMSDSVRGEEISGISAEPTEIAANPQTPLGMMPPLSDEDSGGADLVYTGDDPENYKAIFDHEESAVTDEDRSVLIAAIKTLCEGGDIEDCWNIDQIIRFFVAHNFVLNNDSYTGTTLRNYYLYEADGSVTVFPQNYNHAFCGFQAGADITEELNRAIDTPLNGVSEEARPLWNVIFSNEKYMKLYHEYFDQLLSGFFESGECEKEITRVVKMIEPYMEDKAEDTSADFNDAAQALKLFCEIRSQSIRKQLSGELGSTSGSQTHDDMIDASGVNIAAMGVYGDFMVNGPASPQAPAFPGAQDAAPSSATE